MARLRDSWRTSLPVAQLPRNPQSESIARNRYQATDLVTDPGDLRTLSRKFDGVPDVGAHVLQADLGSLVSCQVGEDGQDRVRPSRHLMNMAYLWGYPTDCTEEEWA